MEKKSFSKKSDCLTYLVINFDKLELENKKLLAQNASLKSENESFARFFVKDEALNSMDKFIRELGNIKAQIIQFNDSTTKS